MCASIISCALLYAISIILFTSAPITSSIFSPKILFSYGSFCFKHIGPTVSLIPYTVTISFAISVATSISLLAPVEISFSAIFSAALPPKSAISFSSISVFDI